MAAPKLRLVFYEDKKGVQSYFYLEKSESLRVVAILKILPKLKKWTSVSEIAKMIGAKLPATLWTIQKLAGIQKIDLMVSGKRKIITRKPVLFIQKEQHNTQNNLPKTKNLRSGVYIRAIFFDLYP